MTEIAELMAAIVTARNSMPAGNALLVGISGIDASGKGFVSKRLAEELERYGSRCALINVDGWLNLPAVRFSKNDAARHFYDNALRLDEMCEQLVLPLKAQRSVCVTADYAEETATEFRPRVYAFKNIDVILLEGIFLFKRCYAAQFDLKIWIECSFETALARAITRGQEGLPSEETVQAYQTIYFLAQRLHFATDRPQESADIVFHNP